MTLAKIAAPTRRAPLAGLLLCFVAAWGVACSGSDEGTGAQDNGGGDDVTTGGTVAGGTSNGGTSSAGVSHGGMPNAGTSSSGSTSGGSSDASDPSSVSINVPVGESGVIPSLAIASGLFFTCVRMQQLSVGAGDFDCILHSYGTVECWGDNSWGGPQDPRPIEGLTGAIAISAGYDHACALMQDATVQCWGDILYENYGPNAPLGALASAVPRPVVGLSNVKAVSAGLGSTCALLGDGTVSCWGVDVRGDLGSDSTGTVQLTPVPVTGLSGVTSISVGTYYACAVLTGGTAVCWGTNEEGMLGNGTTIASPIPVPVSNLVNVRGIAAGTEHTCAELTDGSFACWGNNQDGQLGDGTTTRSLVPVKVTVL